LIEAGAAAQIEDPPPWPDKGEEAAFEPDALTLLFRKIATVEGIEQRQLLPP